MCFPAAVSGFMALLSVSVVQGQNGWGVTYSPSSRQICASNGSSVDISCAYTFPARVDGKENQLLKTSWFSWRQHSDIEKSLNYTGRVTNTCKGRKCTLSISDLRETDSDEYFFRFITNKNRYFGQPGVRLYIRGLKVVAQRQTSGLRFNCLSSCPEDTSFIWFKNGQKIEAETSDVYSPGLLHTDRYSCAALGHEEFPSPPVYAPKLPSVSPSAEVVEGISVTLTCSSDANPAANYTWFKKNENPDPRPLGEGPQLVFRSIQSSDFGEYYCEAENELGKTTSESVSVDVKYHSLSPEHIIRLTLSFLVMISLLLLILWSRKKTGSSTTEPNEPAEMIEMDANPVYENVSAVPAAQTEDTEEQEDMV